ncbi:hypothetical protein Sjap_009187 [Stephania japonica]|uniref:IBH1-like N-terminal domain-containing protein n=1 Tax=Stephania japonica TaxID=461633 RepID=A0AAP0PBI6_9MAGN
MPSSMNHQITSCRTSSITTTTNNPTFLSSSKHVNSCKTQFALRFIQALQRIKAATSTTSSRDGTTPKTLQQRRTRLIKLASDASMASTVGARRLWSRAVLVKIKNRARFHGLEKKKKKVTTRASQKKKKEMLVRKKIKTRLNENLSMNHGSGVVKRSDELRKLVPGGKGMDFCRLLGETAHYIECLNTQVQVMQTLIDAQKPYNS